MGTVVAKSTPHVLGARRRYRKPKSTYAIFFTLDTANHLTCSAHTSMTNFQHREQTVAWSNHKIDKNSHASANVKSIKTCNAAAALAAFVSNENAMVGPPFVPSVPAMPSGPPLPPPAPPALLLGKTIDPGSVFGTATKAPSSSGHQGSPSSVLWQQQH